MNNNFLLREIPTIEFPSISSYVIDNLDEKISSISEANILVDSKYYSKGIPGSYLDCYARETVINMLQNAESFLPKGLKLKVYDAYRPICIQKNLWDYYRNYISNKFPDLSDKEIDFKTSFFVSKPSYNINLPSLHNTGGSIDLTIVNDLGVELNMGTEFDDFSKRAWTNYYEKYDINEEVKINRRILYNVMIESGFTNLPSEWWHYDYGTKFWAYFNNCNAKYQGILDIDFPNRYY